MSQSAPKDNQQFTLDTNTEDTPLDPALLRLRTKLVRLMVISTALSLAILAIAFGLLFYKNQKTTPSSGIKLYQDLPYNFEKEEFFFDGLVAFPVMGKFIDNDQLVALYDYRQNLFFGYGLVTDKGHFKDSVSFTYISGGKHFYKEGLSEGVYKIFYDSKEKKLLSIVKVGATDLTARLLKELKQLSL